ncbi:hypothetical protein Tsubulata_030480 [Turnera subulata]|uniref:C3H1-type domain-containing protein n=1 Tax=Turnera subulata TaxID=218843 RepID=A0A9Q0JCL7_9ROSI|nr:hypothetical protein Tsubulata_030480 [Turnera subulata]
MPLGKYYCDYCDKEFQDTALARTRHLQSSSHLRAKSLWYSNINNSSLHSLHTTSPSPSSTKGLCNRFVQTGFCPYGDSCKYLHATATPQATSFAGNNVPSPIVLGNPLAGEVVRNNMGMPLGNLPPSLMPPPEGGYPPLPFVGWG